MSSVRIDLYSNAGAKLDYEPLTPLSLQYTMALNEIGRYQFTVAASDATDLAIAQQLWFYREGEGLIFKGFVEDINHNVAESGESTFTVMGRSIGAALAWKTTSLALKFADATLSTTVTALLTGSGFSSGSVASPSTNISTRFDGRSLWDALRFVAEVFGLSLREDLIAEEVDVNAFGSDSGIVLRNVETIAEGLTVVPIRSIKKRRYALDIVNKVIPIGQQQGLGNGAPFFDMTASDRSSPYTIQSETGPDGRDVYFIADSTSVTAYGTREKVLQVQNISPLALDSITLAANTLYDAAVNYLTRHKDEQAAYDVEVAGLTHIASGSYRFQVGDTMRVQYNGITEDSDGRRAVLTVDQNLYLMGFTRTFDAGGGDTWRLTLSTILREIPDDGNRTAEFQRQLESAKAAPLPYVLFGLEGSEPNMRLDTTGIQFVDVNQNGVIGMWGLDQLYDDPTDAPFQARWEFLVGSATASSLNVAKNQSASRSATVGALTDNDGYRAGAFGTFWALDIGGASTLTASSNAITPIQTYTSIDTTTDLETINGTVAQSSLLWITAVNGATVTLKHGVDNIFLNGNNDAEITSGDLGWVLLVRYGVAYYEIARSGGPPVSNKVVVQTDNWDQDVGTDYVASFAGGIPTGWNQSGATAVASGNTGDANSLADIDPPYINLNATGEHCISDARFGSYDEIALVTALLGAAPTKLCAEFMGRFPGGNATSYNSVVEGIGFWSDVTAPSAGGTQVAVIQTDQSSLFQGRGASSTDAGSAWNANWHLFKIEITLSGLSTEWFIDGTSQGTFTAPNDSFPCGFGSNVQNSAGASGAIDMAQPHVWYE